MSILDKGFRIPPLPVLVPPQYIKTCNLPFNKTPPVQLLSKLQNLKVPRLSYDLQKVLSDQSKPHFVMDPESSTYHLDSRLYDISHCKRFDFSKLSPFIKPSLDQKLRSMAVENSCRFYASTSSITSILHILQLSWGNWNLNTNRFSKVFQDHSQKFVARFSKVHAIDIKYNSDHGVYGIDNGQTSNTNILSDLGHSLEKFLTTSPEEFSGFLAEKSMLGQVKDSTAYSAEEENPLSYHYSKLHGFLLRAQLDCFDPSLPKKTFDLKTRATIALRYTHDVEYSEAYKIKKFKGFFESFEREDYDLLRSLLLKYGLQSRIGNMDGILLAYHNVYHIFGFQYFSQEKIDKWIYGSSDTAQVCFDLSLRIFKWVLEEITARFPKKNLRILYMKSLRPRNMHFVILPEGEDKTLCFTVTSKLKKGKKTVMQSITQWDNLEDMAMDLSLEEDPEAKGREIVQLYDSHSKFDLSFPTSYFKSAYQEFLNEQ